MEKEKDKGYDLLINNFLRENVLTRKLKGMDKIQMVRFRSKILDVLQDKKCK